MKRTISIILSLTVLTLAFGAFAAEHAGLITSYSCHSPNGTSASLVKTTQAVYFTAVNNVTNNYYTQPVAESILATNLDPARCMNLVIELEKSAAAEQRRAGR